MVINRYTRHPAVSLNDMEASISNPVFWTIPNDYKTVSTAINRGKVIIKMAERTSVARGMDGLADALIHDGKQKRKKGFFHKNKGSFFGRIQ